jgi:hypothetical protein
VSKETAPQGQEKQDRRFAIAALVAALIVTVAAVYFVITGNLPFAIGVGGGAYFLLSTAARKRKVENAIANRGYDFYPCEFMGYADFNR